MKLVKAGVEQMQVGTLRLTFLKVGGRIRQLATKVWLYLPADLLVNAYGMCPYATAYNAPKRSHEQSGLDQRHLDLRLLSHRGGETKLREALHS